MIMREIEKIINKNLGTHYHVIRVTLSIHPLAAIIHTKEGFNLKVEGATAIKIKDMIFKRKKYANKKGNIQSHKNKQKRSRIIINKST